MNKINILAWLTNGLLIILSLAPIGDHIPRPIERSDLIYHGLAYTFLCLLFQASYQDKKLWVAILLIGQGILIEFLQPFFMRHFEYLDMVANTTGVLTGYLVFYISKVLCSTRSTGPSRNTSEKF